MPSSPLFIVHVLHHLQIGGLENGVVNLINRMPRERFRHAVVCVEDFNPEFRARIQRDDVEVVSLHRSRVGVRAMQWRMWRLFRQWRPDIVHSRNLSGLDALLPARLAGCRTVHSEHGFDVADLQGRARKPILLRRLHAPLVQQYLCVSGDLKRLMVDAWGLRASKIRQIYNGVDTDRFQPTLPRRRDLLPQAWPSKDTFVIATVGRAQAVKDQRTLIAAFGQLLRAEPALQERCRLMIVGDGPELPALKSQVAELGLQPWVWLTGARHDVPALLAHADLYVLPSLNEGISNTLLEAMACGLPLLATAVGGNVELVAPGECGDLFPPGDVATLCEQLRRRVTDDALCEREGQAARARALARFSLQSMINGYAETYESI